MDAKIAEPPLVRYGCSALAQAYAADGGAALAAAARGGARRGAGGR